MKLLNILGAVVAVHIAVLVLAIVIPGCSSTSPAPTDNRAPGAVYPAPSSTTPASTSSTMSDADLNPPLMTQVGDDYGPTTRTTRSSPAATTGGRQMPQRPLTAVPLTTSSDYALPAPEAAPTPAPAASYTVQRGDSLWSLAKQNGLSVRELASANQIAADAGLQLGQTLMIPGKVAPATTTAVVGLTNSSASTAPAQSYVIRPGDTLGRIARNHGTTVAELKAFNSMRNDRLRAGDTLSIPAGAEPIATTPSNPSTATTSPSASQANSGYRHTVASGESLTVIAQRYGVRIGDIALANKIRDPSLIRPGQELIIPGWEAPSVVAPATAPVTSLPTTPTIGPAPVFTPTIGAPTIGADDDLDAGLDDDDLSNVPVLTVEDEVKPLGGEDNEGNPPVFE